MLIGDLAGLSGVSARNPPVAPAGGYRDYTDTDIRRLFQIEGLRMLGLSLKQVREALDTQRASPATVLDDLITATRRRIAHENELLHRLETLAERRAVLTISKFPADARTRSVLTTALTDSDPGGAAACGHGPVRAGHRCRHPGAGGSGGGW